jgi:hypothetical protein
MEENKIVATEEELNAIYDYLGLMIEKMSEEEKDFWYNILSKVDPDFEKEN